MLAVVLQRQNAELNDIEIRFRRCKVNILSVYSLNPQQYTKKKNLSDEHRKRFNIKSVRTVRIATVHHFQTKITF